MRKDLSTKIISLVFAIGLWFYIIQVQNPSVERTIKDVPVFFAQQSELENKNLMLINEKDYTVDLKLSGQRKMLVDLEKSEISVTADVGSIEKTGTHSVYTNVALPYGNVEILKQTPSVVTVTVDEIVEEAKEIRVEAVGQPADGYAVGSIKTTPGKVVVRGAKTIVGGIDYVSATVDVSGKNEDISTMATLELVSTSDTLIESTYVSLSKETVDVHCEILKKKTVSIEPVFADGLNSEKAWYRLDDSSVKSIEIAGAASTIDGLDKIRTEEITKEMIRKDGEVEVSLHLPNGVESLGGQKITLKLKRVHKSES